MKPKTVHIRSTVCYDGAREAGYKDVVDPEYANANNYCAILRDLIEGRRNIMSNAAWAHRWADEPPCEYWSSWRVRLHENSHARAGERIAKKWLEDAARAFCALKTSATNKADAIANLYKDLDRLCRGFTSQKEERWDLDPENSEMVADGGEALRHLDWLISQIKKRATTGRWDPKAKCPWLTTKP